MPGPHLLASARVRSGVESGVWGRHAFVDIRHTLQILPGTLPDSVVHALRLGNVLQEVDSRDARSHLRGSWLLDPPERHSLQDFVLPPLGVLGVELGSVMSARVDFGLKGERLSRRVPDVLWIVGLVGNRPEDVGGDKIATAVAHCDWLVILVRFTSES